MDNTVAMSLSSDQVDKFIATKLGFEDWQSRLKEDKLSFLYELIRRHAAVIYYENMTWGARTPEERFTPTITEVIEHTTGTAGGACVHLNYFIKLLLEALGFQVFVAGAAVASVPIPKNHMVTIVQLPNDSASKIKNGSRSTIEGNDTKSTFGVEDLNLKDLTGDGELYLIDVGYGRPIIEPISLSNLPYRGKAGGFEFEFRFNSQTKFYERCVKGGCPIKGPFESETEEKVDYTFQLVPLEFQDFDDSYRRIFTDPSESFFLNTCFLFRFVFLNLNNEKNNNDLKQLKSASTLENGDENSGGSRQNPGFDYKYVSCRGKSIAIGTLEDRQETRYDTYTDMLPVILEWFPHLDPEIVRKAIMNYELIRQQL